MKKSIFSFLLLFFFIFQLVYSQNSNSDDPLLTARYDNLSFKNFIRDIEKEYDIRFFYKDEWIKDIQVNQKVYQTHLSDLLRKILYNSGYSFLFYPRSTYIIIPENENLRDVYSGADFFNGTAQLYGKAKTVGNPINRGKYQTAIVRGTLFDAQTDSAIIGAVIYAKDVRKGTTTDSKGNYEFELPTGKHLLEISSVGYENTTKRIELINTGEYDIPLFEERIGIEEVVVKRKRADRNISGTQMGVSQLTPKELEKLPSFMGETDIMRSMTLLPGVQTIGEASSGFNIRGGSVDQNLILVEDAPLFNTSHVFGFFSTINSDAIEDVTLYKGSIPSQYGGRASSLMDIKIKRGNMEGFSANGGIGLINSSISVEGPLVKDNCSFMLGGRSTYSDWVLGTLPDPDLRKSNAGFYDINGKIFWQINSHNNISVFGYNSSDNFGFGGKEQYEYGNMLGNIQYKHTFNSTALLSVNSSYSKYNNQITEETDPYDPTASVFNSWIEYMNASINFSLYAFADHSIDAGISAGKYGFSPGNYRPANDSSKVIPLKIENEQSYEGAIYINDHYDINDEISLSAGLRYSYYAPTGPVSYPQYMDNMPRSDATVQDTLVYKDGEIIKQYGGWEPRLSFKYELNKRSSLKASYNRNRQNIQLLSNTASVAPADIWKSADRYFEPLIADQFSLGYFRNFKKNMFETSAELYYKKMENLIDYKNGATIFLNPSIEQDLVHAKGKAYGVELLVKKNYGDLTGWLSYTFSRSFRKSANYPGEQKINNGAYFPSSYDKPHDLTFSFTYKLTRRWSFSGNFTHSTGRPETLPESKYQIRDYQLVYFSERNKYRIPDYHRLDLSITLDGSLKKSRRWKSSWTISVYNVYGRSNAYSVYYTKDDPSKINDYQFFSLYKLSIIDRPIPTITYNFIFK